MDEAQALVESLGQHTVDYIGKDNLRALTVVLDPNNMTAHAEICLEDDTWPAREAVIDRMIELRLMFLSEISIDYAFSGSGCVDAEAVASEYEYAYA